MAKLWPGILSIMLLSGLLVACTTPAPAVFTDSAKPIEVVAGQQFAVALESNPTTGFQWEVTIDNSGTYTQVGAGEYTQGATKPGMAGAGGTVRFTFQAAKAGTGSVKFTYRRSFEPPNLPTNKVVLFNVVVK